jgi:hypothetical protein
LQSSIQYLYKSNQKIRSSQPITLISNVLDLKLKTSNENLVNIQFELNKNKNHLKILFVENINFPNYLPASLKYTSIQSSLLVEPTQFIDTYMTLGYFENISEQSLEIVKLKSKYSTNRQVLLISNDDCLTIPKAKIPTKSVNDLVIQNININQIGKIIIDNGQVLTVQKGRPYFFPNCQIQDSMNEKSISYKIISEKQLPFANTISTKRDISLNYYDITKSFNEKIRFNNFNPI